MYKKCSSIELKGAGGDARSFNIAAGGPCVSSDACHIAKISLWESELQSLEKKIFCDKRDCGQTTTILLAKCVPEVGIFKKKISCRNRSLASSLNLPGQHNIPLLPATPGSIGHTILNRSRRRRCLATILASRSSRETRRGQRERSQCH